LFVLFLFSTYMFSRYMFSSNTISRHTISRHTISRHMFSKLKLNVCFLMVFHFGHNILNKFWWISLGHIKIMFLKCGDAKLLLHWKWLLYLRLVYIYIWSEPWFHVHFSCHTHTHTHTHLYNLGPIDCGHLISISHLSFVWHC
jgi:hypothetical protein